MKFIERTAYLARSRSAAFERKTEQAENIIRRWLKRCEKPYVAFSGGKDSAVCLDLVRSVDSSVPATFADDEWILPETEELLANTPDVIRVASHEKHTEWFTSHKEKPDDEGLYAPQGLAEWTRSKGYDGVTIGIRADENSRRKTHIRSFGTCFEKKNGVVQCYPLAWWETRDVWAYLLSRNVPYNRAYDRLSEIGIAPDQQRIGPFASERALPYGQLAILKMGWPEQYERFKAAYPEAGGYA